jgi:hypothetical protein
MQTGLNAGASMPEYSSAELGPGTKKSLFRLPGNLLFSMWVVSVLRTRNGNSIGKVVRLRPAEEFP